MVPGTTGHFLASEAWRCSASPNSAIRIRTRRRRRQHGDTFGIHQTRRGEFGDSDAARSPNRIRSPARSPCRCRGSPTGPSADRAPAPPGRMQRVVIDGDGGADRIFGDGLGDLEIFAVLADADAVVAQLPAGDGIFVDDVGEVALLGAMPLFPVAVDHPGLAHLGLRHHHLARRRRPLGAARTCSDLVGGGDEEQPERG